MYILELYLPAAAVGQSTVGARQRHGTGRVVFHAISDRGTQQIAVGRRARGGKFIKHAHASVVFDRIAVPHHNVPHFVRGMGMQAIHMVAVGTDAHEMTQFVGKSAGCFSSLRQVKQEPTSEYTHVP